MHHGRDIPGYRGAFAFLLAAVAALLIVAVTVAVGAPDRVPANLNDVADHGSWSNTLMVLGVFVAIGAGFALLLGIRWPGVKWLNLINLPPGYRTYWMADDARKVHLADRVTMLFRVIAALACVAIAGALLAMLITARADHPTGVEPSWLMPIVAAVFIIGSGVMIIKTVRDLKPPRESKG